MDRHDRRANLPLSDQPHRVVYRIIIGLAAWLVASSWGFFAGGYTGLALTVVSLFILVAVMLPLLLSRIWRRHAKGDDSGAESQSFAYWLALDFDSHSGRVSAQVATIEILLPIVAVAFGMTLFALVHHFDTLA